jgi:hypothetical protein
MYQSKMLIEKKNKNVYIDLYTINYEEDDEIIPDYFIKLPYLIKSTNSEYPKFSKKKLPFIQDIFDSINKYVNADYIIFTNSDIIIHNNFYQFIYKQIIKHNFDSMIINRRDNIPKFINNIQLNKEHLNLIFELSGERHIGRDCFIIENSILKKINMKNMFIAHPPWGLMLMKYLSKLANKFKMLRSEFLTFHLGNDNNHQSSNKLDELTKINIINSKSIRI